MFKTARREFWNFPTWEWASSGDLKSFRTGAEEKSRVSEGEPQRGVPASKRQRGQATGAAQGTQVHPGESPRCHSDKRWRQGQRSPGGQTDTCLSSPLAALTGNLLHFPGVESRGQASSQGFYPSSHRWLWPLHKGPHQGHPKPASVDPGRSHNWPPPARAAEVRKNEQGAKPRIQRQSHPNFRRWRRPAFRQKWKPEPPSHQRYCPTALSQRSEAAERRSERDQASRLSQESILKARRSGELKGLEGSVNPQSTPHLFHRLWETPKVTLSRGHTDSPACLPPS